MFVELAGHRGTPLHHRAPKFLLPLLGDGEIRRLGDSSPKPPNLQSSKTPSSESNPSPRAVRCPVAPASRRFVQLSKIKPRRVWGGFRTRLPSTPGTACPLINSRQNRGWIPTFWFHAVLPTATSAFIFRREKIFSLFSACGRKWLSECRFPSMSCG